MRRQKRLLRDTTNCTQDLDTRERNNKADHVELHRNFSGSARYGQTRLVSNAEAGRKGWSFRVLRSSVWSTSQRVVASLSGWACFFSASVALADTLGHTGVLRCTRLLFHHQCHLKANQTRRQDPLEYNALCAPAQDAHLFTVGLSGTTPSRFEPSKTNKHTLT